MELIYNVFQTLLNAGPTVLLPLIILGVGIVFGVKPAKAFRSGLTVGIGFAGIKLVINLLSGSLGPAAKAMVERWGFSLDVLDVGWGTIAAVTWASPIIPILIFAILAINIIMLILKKTNTLDVDIWNYHHMAIVGVMTYFVTGNIFFGVGASIAMAIVTFKLSDWSAGMVEDYFGLPGVSLPTVSALSSLIVAVPLNWLLDKVPGVNKINFSLKDAKKYLGFFGEPMIMGLILGGVIGALAGYDFTNIANVAVNMAAVLVLIPKSSLFMEGLMPISEGAKKFAKKKFKGRDLFIGLDAAVVSGNPDVITTSLIVIPLTILLAVVLPGNRMLPFADLAVVPFRVALVVALTRGNLFKNVVIGLCTTAAILLAGTVTAPVLTDLASSVGIDLSLAAGALISSFAATSLTQSFIIFMAFTVGNPIINIPLLIIGFAVIWYYMDVIKPKKDAKKNPENNEVGQSA